VKTRRAINRDRTSYAFKTFSCAHIARAFNFEIEIKNIILVTLRTLEFSHSLDPSQTPARPRQAEGVGDAIEIGRRLTDAKGKVGDMAGCACGVELISCAQIRLRIRRLGLRLGFVWLFRPFRNGGAMLQFSGIGI
jgi:hypothetical protein